MEHAFVRCGDHRLHVEIHGDGPKVTLLMPGLLLDSGLHRRLARDLADQGHRVVLLEMLGHGRSDKPRRASAHRIERYADHVVVVLDELGIDQAVIGGVSLGANVALTAAFRSPDRVRGLLLEMPVLEHATPIAALLFVPLLLAMHGLGPLARAVTRLAGRLPRTPDDSLNAFLNTASMAPAEINAVLHGVLMGSQAPTEEERATITAPALVIGHQADPLHPFDDAERLTRQLPNARMVQARSVLELRLRPARLTGEISRFLDRVWAARPVGLVGDVG